MKTSSHRDFTHMHKKRKQDLFIRWRQWAEEEQNCWRDPWIKVSWKGCSLRLQQILTRAGTACSFPGAQAGILCKPWAEAAEPCSVPGFRRPSHHSPAMLWPQDTRAHSAVTLDPAFSHLPNAAGCLMMVWVSCLSSYENTLFTGSDRWVTTEAEPLTVSPWNLCSTANFMRSNYEEKKKNKKLYYKAWSSSFL